MYNNIYIVLILIIMEMMRIMVITKVQFHINAMKYMIMTVYIIQYNSSYIRLGY